MPLAISKPLIWTFWTSAPVQPLFGPYDNKARPWPLSTCGPN